MVHYVLCLLRSEAEILSCQQVTARKQDIDHPERSLSNPVESILTVTTCSKKFYVKVMTLMLSAHTT